MSQPLFLSMRFFCKGQSSPLPATPCLIPPLPIAVHHIFTTYRKKVILNAIYNTAVAEPYLHRHLSIGGIGCSDTLPASPLQLTHKACFEECAVVFGAGYPVITIDCVEHAVLVKEKLRLIQILLRQRTRS